jgi:hypothetical protein
LRRQREIAALKGEVVAEPETEDAAPADDLPPPLSNLSLPERVQLTAGAASPERR